MHYHILITVRVKFPSLRMYLSFIKYNFFKVIPDVINRTNRFVTIQVHAVIFESFKEFRMILLDMTC